MSPALGLLTSFASSLRTKLSPHRAGTAAEATTALKRTIEGHVAALDEAAQARHGTPLLHHVSVAASRFTAAESAGPAAKRRDDLAAASDALDEAFVRLITLCDEELLSPEAFQVVLAQVQAIRQGVDLPSEA